MPMRLEQQSKDHMERLLSPNAIFWLFMKSNVGMRVKFAPNFAHNGGVTGMFALQK